MNRLKTTRIAISALFISSTFAFVVPTQAQPMMGEMGMHHDGPRMHERMAKHWAQRQAELKTKLHLTAAQESAWNVFVQNTKMPAKALVQPLDREGLAKLSTPERMDKLAAAHETNLAAMQSHMKQRSDATRTFYNQLSVEQQKVFDAETLPEQSHWKGKRN